MITVLKFIFISAPSPSHQPLPLTYSRLPLLPDSITSHSSSSTQHWNDCSEMQMWLFSSSAYIFFSMAYHCSQYKSPSEPHLLGLHDLGLPFLPASFFTEPMLELCQVTIHCPETPCHLLPPRSMQVTLSFESSATWPPSLLFHLVKVSPSLSAHLKPHLLFSTFPEPLEQIQSPPLLHWHLTSCTHFSNNSSQRHLCFTYLLLPELWGLRLLSTLSVPQKAQNNA